MMHFTYFRAVALSPLFLVACDSQETKSLLERQGYYNRQIAIYEERVQKSNEKLEAEKEEMEEISKRAEPALKSISSREAMLAEMGELINTLSEMENAMLEKAGLIESYKKIFQPKSIPNETNLGDLSLPNGMIYRGAIAKESTATHLSIAHSGGFAKVPYPELPESLKARIVSAPIESIAIPNPWEVIARKPDSIMSVAELAEVRKREEDELTKSRRDEVSKWEQEREEAMRKREEENRKEAESRKAYDEKYEAFLRDSNAINEQIAKLSARINALEGQKSDLEYANQFGAVRQARADFIKKTAPIEKEIAELNEQMSTLESKKSSLVPPVR